MPNLMARNLDCTHYKPESTNKTLKHSFFSYRVNIEEKRVSYIFGRMSITIPIQFIYR